MTERPVLTATPSNAGVDAAVAAARRVVAALLHAGGSSPAEMTEVAARLTEVAEHLEQHAPTTEQRLVDMWGGEGVTRHDPVTGPENAVAPPLPLRGLPDGSIEGRATLGLPYQGPPGCVHGGVSALLLDHTLGVANHWAGVSGMTGTLTLRYHRPTPLFEELVVRARQVSVDGRKIRTTGEIVAGGEVCVSADGLFVDKHLPRPGRG
ncbi:MULTISPECIES: PaaI family thioesterase [unclassified Nocardioides]|uniref:PaaI family thioesterase n=1 Tax=unclassified Nocardioides TaxID=2615069 RepID=UPI002666788A|nr:PaaI family thioesterase [Nocardioides sp. Arc9.136]WKN47007.1 PaaI family thioesterase [Nocardioides sp. Arc9.136]